MARKDPLFDQKSDVELSPEEIDRGATVDIQDDEAKEDEAGLEIEEKEDGSAIVRLPDISVANNPEFYANLAETLPEDVLDKIASDLIEKVERDREARKQRDKQYAEGLKRTGMGKDAPGGAEFDGASRVVHPALARACVEFTSRVMREIFPPQGPVKTVILTGATPERIDRATRKAKHMNYQLTRQVKEYASELEQTLTQTPLGGGQYMYWWWDNRAKRPRVEFFPIDKVALPYAASNFYSATRKTLELDLVPQEVARRVASGLYRGIDLDNVSTLAPEQTDAEVANAKIEGKEDPGMNEDGVRSILMSFWSIEIEEDERAADAMGDAPYTVHVDEHSKKVLGLYRNWEPDDETFTEMDWVAEYPFFPWRGAYPIGLPHLIGGMSAAATGALRALLDSAHINNSATLLAMKGTQLTGQSKEVSITQVTQVEGPAGVDDIRKVVAPMPFNPPSGVLFELLGFLDQQMRDVVATADDKIAGSGPDAPVGTTQSLIEQGSMTYSAIHARMHRAQQRSLDILHRMNRMYLAEELKFDPTQDLFIGAADYEGEPDIMPVSDPLIFSEAQRYAQVQSVVQLMGTAPQLYDARAVHRRALEQLRIPNINEILPEPPAQKEQNAATENVALCMGTPARVFPDQDHLAHLETHLKFYQSPALGSNPAILPTLAGPMLEHLKQHVSFWYVSAMIEAGSAAAGRDITKMVSDKPDVSKALDQLLAAVSTPVTTSAQQVLAGVLPLMAQLLQQVQQFAQQAQQSAPQDPTAAAAAAAQAETQRKTQADQQKLAIEQQKITAEQKDAQLEAETKIRVNTDDNQTAKDLTLMKIEMTGHGGGMINGNSLNRPGGA